MLRVHIEPKKQKNKEKRTKMQKTKKNSRGLMVRVGEVSHEGRRAFTVERRQISRPRSRLFRSKVFMQTDTKRHTVTHASVDRLHYPDHKVVGKIQKSCESGIQRPEFWAPALIGYPRL